MADLFDLLDKEIDDIKDLPSFKIPDTGIYKLRMKFETKEINKKPSVIAKFVVRELVELADSAIPEADRAKPEDKFDIPHILKDEEGNDSEMAWGKLKELVKPFEEMAGSSNLKVVVKFLVENETDITAQITKRERKDKKGEFNAQISNVTID